MMTYSCHTCDLPVSFCGGSAVELTFVVIAHQYNFSSVNNGEKQTGGFFGLEHRQSLCWSLAQQGLKLLGMVVISDRKILHRGGSLANAELGHFYLEQQ